MEIGDVYDWGYAVCAEEEKRVAKGDRACAFRCRDSLEMQVANSTIRVWGTRTARACLRLSLSSSFLTQTIRRAQ